MCVDEQIVMSTGGYRVDRLMTEQRQVEWQHAWKDARQSQLLKKEPKLMEKNQSSTSKNDVVASRKDTFDNQK